MERFWVCRSLLRVRFGQNLASTPVLYADVAEGDVSDRASVHSRHDDGRETVSIVRNQVADEDISG